MTVVRRSGSDLLVFVELAATLRRYAPLIWHLTRRELAERYAGQVLGTLWAVLHPLFLMLIYILVFVHVFKVRLAGGDVGVSSGYTAYLLSGLIPWLAAVETLTRGTAAISGNPSFIKQMLFPAEVLPVRCVTTSLPSQLVSTLVLICYLVLTPGGVRWTIVLWPLALILQSMFLLGACYVLSAIGVYFRDVKDVLLLLTTGGIFVSPVFYTAEMLPESLRFVLSLNPLSLPVWVQQDIFYYGRIAHPESWIALTVGAGLVLCLGFRVFRALRPWFAEAL